jgi:hypothetical protein
VKKEGRRHKAEIDSGRSPSGADNKDPESVLEGVRKTELQDIS